MRFGKLVLENFRSFHGQHEFDFSSYGPGLHFIVGANQAEPDLGGNGAGKSSLFEALFWALYGKTTRNLRGGSIRNWTCTDTMRCALRVEVNGQQQEVVRSWSPNTLEVNGRSVDQEGLEDLIGVSADTFLHSVLIGQFATTFFDLAPTPKLAVFAKILELDVWLQRSSMAATKAKDAENKALSLSRELDHISGQMEQLEQQIAAHEKAAKDFEDNREQELKELAAVAARLQEEVSAIEAKLKKQKNVVAVLSKQVDAAQEKAHTTSDQDSQYSRGIYNLEAELRALKKEVTKHELSLKTFQTLGEVCPTCCQPLGKGHIKRIVTEMNGGLDAARKEFTTTEAKLVELNDALSTHKAAARGVEGELARAQQKLREAEWATQECESSLASTNREVIRALNLIEQKERDNNPFQNLLDKAERQAEDLVNAFEKVEADLDKKQAEKEAHEFWIKGFKDIRLMILERALATLEVEVNNYLVELGLTGWEVHFDVERETKAGKITKGFVVNITSPQAEEPVPWEAWSGGELQRLRLAGALGIANMVRRQIGLLQAPLILDEPTQHLSTEGIDALLVTLSGIAEAQGIQIWLIDHHSLEFGGFNSITRVVKTDDGSRIQTDNT